MLMKMSPAFDSNVSDRMNMRHKRPSFCCWAWKRPSRGHFPYLQSIFFSRYNTLTSPLPSFSQPLLSSSQTLPAKQPLREKTPPNQPYQPHHLLFPISSSPPRHITSCPLLTLFNVLFVPSFRAHVCRQNSFYAQAFHGRVAEVGGGRIFVEWDDGCNLAMCVRDCLEVEGLGLGLGLGVGLRRK